MVLFRLPSASRQTAFTLVCFWLAAWTAPAREFSVQMLSEPTNNARRPSLGATGLVAWQAFTPVEPEISLHPRPDVLRGVPGAQRASIVVWRDGQARDITASDSGIVYAENPRVHQEDVVFVAHFRATAGGGYPFHLTAPPKTEEMKRKEAEYPDLFDPPWATQQDDGDPEYAAEKSARAAQWNSGYWQTGIWPQYQAATNTGAESPADGEAGAATNAGAEPPAEGASGIATNRSNLQYQMWRHSGSFGDIAVYRGDGNIQRLTPGGRYVSMPAMSEAGLAFQHARGWPYGYEIIAWKPGTTNLIQLTTNYYYALNVNIHGNELVYQAWDGNDYEIYRYRFDTEEQEQITNNSFDDTAPVVWNGQIAWVAFPTVNAEIFFLADGAIRKISEGTQDNSDPAIWEGRVVWQGYDDTDLEIYYFDGRRTIKLTSNTWDDMTPVIDAGLIAWMSYVDNWDAEIMALDLSDNTPVQLTDNEFEDSFPQTAAERVVWQTLTGEGSVIQLATPTGPRANSLP